MLSEYLNRFFGPHTKLRQEFENSIVTQWSLLGILVIGFIMIVATPYISWRSEQASQIHNIAAREARLIDLADRRTEIEKNHQVLETLYKESQAMLVDAPSFNRALSLSLEKIEAMYQPIGLRFTTRRFGEPSQIAWAGEKVPSRWQWVGSSQSISDYIYKLANSDTIIVPESMDIKPKASRNGDVQFELSATLWSVRSLSIEQLKQQERALAP